MTPTLLIAEDDIALAAMVARLAREAGFETQVVHAGDAARASLEADAPDALLTDLRLPGLDGLELLRDAKALDSRRPVLLMTGYATPMNAIEAFHLGVSDILLKPFELEQARAALARLKQQLDQRQRLTQLAEQVARRWNPTPTILPVFGRPTVAQAAVMSPSIAKLAQDFRGLKLMASRQL